MCHKIHHERDSISRKGWKIKTFPRHLFIPNYLPTLCNHNLCNFNNHLSHHRGWFKINQARTTYTTVTQIALYLPFSEIKPAWHFPSHQINWSSGRGKQVLATESRNPRATRAFRRDSVISRFQIGYWPVDGQSRIRRRSTDLYQQWWKQPKVFYSKSYDSS